MPSVSDEGIYENDEFSHNDGDGEYDWLSGADTSDLFCFEIGIEAGCDEGGHVEPGAGLRVYRR